MATYATICRTNPKASDLRSGTTFSDYALQANETLDLEGPMFRAKNTNCCADLTVWVNRN